MIDFREITLVVWRMDLREKCRGGIVEVHLLGHSCGSLDPNSKGLEINE